jgi:hypothetical protein
MRPDAVKIDVRLTRIWLEPISRTSNRREEAVVGVPGFHTWPDTQQVIHDMIGHLPADHIRKLTHENAAKLYRHPLPEKCRP